MLCCDWILVWLVLVMSLLSGSLEVMMQCWGMLILEELLDMGMLVLRVLNINC